ncbi:MAG TPA: gamma-glutamyltransferase [Cytophagales bacterium]|nr:gamma-glutamyltransferase [Cytophagales bacterium]
MKKILLYLFLCFSVSALGQDRLASLNHATRAEVLATNGMVATSQPLCTQVGLDVLKAGGNAIDAAIAANACLGLMEPTGNGIGGDLFAIVWDAEAEELVGLNASGRSPMDLTLDYFKENNIEAIPVTGPLPVSVPGAVSGWEALLDRWGTKPLSELVAPTVQYAREGFPVSELIAYYWAIGARIHGNQPNFADTYLVDGDHAPAKGEVFRNPALANTLETLGKKGPREFYEGKMAETMAEFIQAQGGFLSVDDLNKHTVDWVNPVSVNYRGYDVWELPPNGQGIAALQMLTILEGYDLASMGFGSAEYIHTFTEAKKLAFEDRAKYYADMDFFDVPVKELLSESYAEERRSLINPNRAARAYEPGELARGETIYLTTADKDGNMVSLIQSNFRGMGSGMVPPGLGFMLQDRGELFNLEEGHANVYEPGKRPFHTIIPAFITKEGKPLMSFGLMGGAMQPQGHAQIVINIVDFGMNVQEAGDAPRLRHVGSSQPTGEEMTNGGTLNMESGIAYEEIKKLLRRGHRIQWSNGGYGGYQAIWRDPETGVYYGATESRKDGQAAGY